MNRSPSQSVRAAAWLFVCAASAAAIAQAPTQDDARVLLDRALEPHLISLVSISDEAIVYKDDLGRRRQATIGGFVALLPAGPDDVQLAHPSTHPAGAGPTPGVLELADGQRFPGQPAQTGGESDALVWNHPLLGRLVAPVDSIARIVMRQSTAPALPLRPDAVNDQLLLVNGDRLVGFVVSLGDPVEIEVGDETISLPIERIADASLANPPAPLSGLVLWLDDGTVAVVASLQTTPDQGVSVRLKDGQTTDIPLANIRAVAFSAGRLVPLASLDPISQRPLGERPFADPVRVITSTGADGATDLNTPDLDLPGPMEVNWKLPAHVVRFAGVAELPLESLPWGDCEFVVQLNGVELLRQRLNQDHTRAEFSLPVEAGELTIAVEPGRFGPVSDRVIIRRPLLLTE